MLKLCAVLQPHRKVINEGSSHERWSFVPRKQKRDSTPQLSACEQPQRQLLQPYVCHAHTSHYHISLRINDVHVQIWLCRNYWCYFCCCYAKKAHVLYFHCNHLKLWPCQKRPLCVWFALVLCDRTLSKEATLSMESIFTGHDCTWIWLIQEALELIFASFTTLPILSTWSARRTYTSEPLIFYVFFKVLGWSSQWSYNYIH